MAEPLDETPTHPLDYAAINATWGALLAGVLLHLAFIYHYGVPDPVAYFLPPLALALVIHFGVSFVVWLIARGSDVHVSIGQCFVLVPVVVLFSMVPVSIAGWGVREGAMVVALGLVGVARAPALAVSVLFGLTLAVSGLPGGFLWLRSAERTRVREATSSSSSLV
jgi:hypothetical protein